MRNVRLLLLASTTFTALAQKQISPKQIQEFDAYVEQIRYAGFDGMGFRKVN